MERGKLLIRSVVSDEEKTRRTRNGWNKNNEGIHV